jgi:hypothetical protein
MADAPGKILYATWRCTFPHFNVNSSRESGEGSGNVPFRFGSLAEGLISSAGWVGHGDDSSAPCGRLIF